MRTFRNALLSGLLLLLAVAATMSSGQSIATSDVIAQAQRQITAYLAQLADLHCTETVTQEKLAVNGHVESSEREEFDYLIMMSGTGDEFQLNESRVESSDSRHKLLTKPMLISNGISTVLLVFHPYYRDSFEFEVETEQLVAGRSAIPIHFAHIPGRRTPAALALRGREYPLDLEGTAWLDKTSGEVIKVDATLLHDMSDVGLRSLKLQVEYKPAKLGTRSITMPALAVVDVTTPHQHWRNTHAFNGYKPFSAEAEQDPTVKLHPTPAGPAVPTAPPTGSKENP
jgi:hypothetical protein